MTKAKSFKKGPGNLSKARLLYFCNILLKNIVLQPIVKVVARPLILKTRSAPPSQDSRKNTERPRQVSGPSSRTKSHGRHVIEEDDDDDEDDEDADEDDFSELRPKRRQKARRFRNEDLPGLPQTMLPFRDLLIPRWLHYYFALDSP